ncbi:hypothetical protein GmHk_09G026050 [Glycine max]|nr:hypothetical protein GmHk_09G026050 [Glycine max]
MEYGDNRKELKEAIKIELSQIASQHSSPVDVPDPDVLAACVSTKGSCAEAAANVVAKEPSAVDVTSMGLYIVGVDCTRLVALGKVFDSAAMIHNVPYADDVVRVNVLTVYDGDARVTFPTSEIQYVREAINTFIGWPTHLVKIISDDSDHNVLKPVGRVDGCTAGAAQDPLGELMKIFYDVYQKPVEVPWDGTKFVLPNVEARFYITHADVAEIIAGLWMIAVEAEVMVQCMSIHNAKERRQDCQHYIETWVKESQRQLYLGAYLNQAHWQLVVLCPRENIVVWFCSLRKKPDVNIKVAINSAMKKITSTFEGMSDQAAPRWIEPKSHLQTGGYECAYYVMHWMWCIVIGSLRDEWNKFSDGTALDMEAMTTLCKKRASYFLAINNMGS